MARRTEPTPAELLRAEDEAKIRRIEYTGPVDGLGRRPFTVSWYEPDGVFRPEPSNEDGEPVGFRRGQCFRANPADYLRRWRADGMEVIETGL